MPKPNFFIVGAPKSGTTALSEYLRKHPNVFMSTPKELHFFSKDIPKYSVAASEDEYLKYFEDASESQWAIGEASVFYMYSKVALRNIYEFNPNAKIIVFLRNSLHIVHAMHSQLLYSKDEEEMDVARAWDMANQRKVGKNVPTHCRDKKILYYDEIAKTGEQLERVLDVFPKNQVKIIFFEDFISNTGKVYREVLKFLDLPDDKRKVFPVINQNKRHRLEAVALFTQRTPQFLVNIGTVLKRRLKVKRLGFFYVLEALRKINMVKEKRKPLSMELRRKIIEEYREDINKLSLLTKRDLSRWLEYKNREYKKS
jgi:hypothetical protein